MSVAELSREGLSTVARLESEAPFQPLPSVELTVVIPTLNEGDNVPLIVQRLNRALAGIAWEAVFVDDDSADGTADAVRAPWHGAKAISAVCNGSAGAALARLASRACWRAPRPILR